ncbi:Hcp family type VI secretion system effector [Paenibacillus radicis (ex Xue et al. 2023)]|uniref:Type VI secretion system tube protein Hcp n=1 Tax=Paenibacillus radicis (ex Xue et al. 2023) TaxID=2972489 RepID=A0ABT1YCF4_9BACL|nr:type VI secretion system tube protein Hcp [Paenibacillus radicis (ex Xue et al. 2023)]MCR8630873.1 type VI secretion system tube protein Hcp [Paenibacillus radicis (ex Xue et al. 2023)]
MITLKKMLLSMLISWTLMLTFSVIPAAAATTGKTEVDLNYDVYMKLEGIEGEATVEKFEKWIVLSDIHFEVSNTSSNSSGGGGASGKPTVKEFMVIKQFDSSSVPLFLNTLTGKHMKNGKIVFVSRGDSPTPLLTIELSDVVVSNYDFNNTNETISLEFNKIQLSYSTTDEKGNKTPLINGGFDFKQNKVQ